MQEKNLYEYAVIRVVPKVEREEFINVGIIMFCKKARFIKVVYTVDSIKLHNLCKTIDINQIEQNLESFLRIAHGDKSAGPIAKMDLSERFRWLTAIRSSVIQTSRPHPGLCNNLEETTQRVFEEFVI